MLSWTTRISRVARRQYPSSVGQYLTFGQIVQRTYASMYPHELAQPNPNSHPHMFYSSEELTPGKQAHAQTSTITHRHQGITKEEYHQRRKRLVDSIPDASLVILRAASIKYMSKNILFVKLSARIKTLHLS